MLGSQPAGREPAKPTKVAAAATAVPPASPGYQASSTAPVLFSQLFMITALPPTRRWSMSRRLGRCSGKDSREQAYDRRPTGDS